MPSSDALRAELSYRIRASSPESWNEFSTLWMAFNAMYGGEPDRKERSRVMTSIRRNMNEQRALRVLRSATKSVDRILEIPPGNMMMNRLDPNFRAASIRYSAMYRNRAETSVGRLAAVAAVLYQIRCNLLHGDKDPQVQRDRMLVEESVLILKALLPQLEAAIGNH